MAAIPVLLLLLALLLLALSFGARRWDARTRSLLGRLADGPAGRVAPSAAPPPVRFDSAAFAALPPPVNRYLRAVLRDGKPQIATATIAHSGRFLMQESARAPRAFTSHEAVRIYPPAFVWDGRIALAPLLRVHVHDAYVAGEGILHASLAGLRDLADLRGTAAAARGQLARFAAEAPWYPTALLPGPGVRWAGIDDRHAQLTLDHAGTSVQLNFGFGDDDLIASVRVEDRPRLVGDTFVPTPWEGHFWNYDEREGLRVPLDGEVAWVPASGRLPPYWRGHLDHIRYTLHE